MPNLRGPRLGCAVSRDRSAGRWRRSVEEQDGQRVGLADDSLDQCADRIGPSHHGTTDCSVWLDQCRARGARRQVGVGNFKIFLQEYGGESVLSGLARLTSNPPRLIIASVSDAAYSRCHRPRSGHQGVAWVAARFDEHRPGQGDRPCVAHRASRSHQRPTG